MQLTNSVCTHSVAICHKLKLTEPRPVTVKTWAYSQREDESESHFIPCLKCEKLVVDKVKVSLDELGDSKPKHYKLRSVQAH